MTETPTTLSSHWNEKHAEAQTARISVALGRTGVRPGAALFDLAVELGVPTALTSLGVTEGDVQKAADIALKNPYWNPAPIEREGIVKLVANALHGNRPA